MKISKGYLLRSVAGKNLVVSVGSDVAFNGMLTLNDTGVFIWNLLSKDLTIEEIFDSCYEHFEIDEADRPDAKRSIQSLCRQSQKIKSSE